VFLFFYGMERRLLEDIRKDASLQSEIPVIQAELRELLAVYGAGSASFKRHANEFRDLISAFVSMGIPLSDLVPLARDLEFAEFPDSLRLGLGRFAAEQRPIPAPWALAWAWYAPDIYVRTPASRCPEMFARLFAARYRQANGEGITVPKTRQAMALSYRPASSGIDLVTIAVDHLSDVHQQTSAVAKLRDVMDQVTTELNAYSRYLGKYPKGATSLEAVALLPSELVDDSLPEVKRLREWAARRFGTSESFAVSGAEVLRRWENTASEKLNKAEAVRLSQAFERVGLGLEPDVRFGGPPISATGQVVVFRSGMVADHTASTAYNAATTLLHLTAAVSAADGAMTEDEVEHMATHIQQSLHLSAGERVRLHAHLKWLATTEIKLAGLKKRFDMLTADQRSRIGEAAVAVASADGVVSPREVTTLQRIYTLLGMDHASVTIHLHQSLTRTRPASGQEPVTVRPASLGLPGYRVPPRLEPVAPVPGPGFALDDHVIQQTLRDTAAVTALLGNIFADDEEPGLERVPGTAVVVATISRSNRQATLNGEAVQSLAGLDIPHSLLLRMLASRSRISQLEFDDFANTVGVMPGGALDVLNEAVLDALDEPIIEPDGEGNLIISTDLIQELLS
jgi:tellurite resistance protein